MGFRLSSFLSGMAEGAVEIEDRVRTRNEKIIDRALARREERTEESVKARREKEDAYNKLSTLMDNYDLTDEQKYTVLKHGPEIAAKWLETIPKIAAKKGRSVADYVDMADSDASSFTLSKALEEGRLPGMTMDITDFAPAGLQRGIFSSDYDAQAKARAKAQDESMGYVATEQTDMALPEGKIDLMAMYEPEKPKIGSFTPKQTYDQLNARIANALNVNFSYNDDGSINLIGKNEEAIKKAKQLTNDAYEHYNNALRDGTFDVDYNQDLAIAYAVGEALPPPKVDLIPGGNNQGSAGGNNQGSAVVSDSPMVIAQRLINEAASRGVTMSPQEAEQRAKEILDKLRAEAQ